LLKILGHTAFLSLLFINVSNPHVVTIQKQDVFIWECTMVSGFILHKKNSTELLKLLKL